MINSPRQDKNGKEAKEVGVFPRKTTGQTLPVNSLSKAKRTQPTKQTNQRQSREDRTRNRRANINGKSSS